MTHHYTLEPHDPIVLGDGRSIGANTMTGTMDLPFPSTLAGLMRTTLGLGNDGPFDATKIPELLNQSLVGPLLTRLEPSPELYVPAPADALFLTVEGQATRGIRRRLTPIAANPDEATDLDPSLHPVGLPDLVLDKPCAGPRYWRWSRFEQWLVSPPRPAARDEVDLDDLGLRSLQHEERIHVALDSKTRTVIDGAMFRTKGVRYTHRTEGRFERFGLRFAWSGSNKALEKRVLSLGGERRLSGLTTSKTGFPSPSKDLINAIERNRRVRLVLLTPAIFDLGFRPTHFPDAKLIACAVGRPSVVSGWDHCRTDRYPRGRPKPSRRCAPAGSVYWLELQPEVDVKRWVDEHWFKNISTHEQDRRDGFGLAVVGAGGDA